MKPQIQDAISSLGYKSSYAMTNGVIESWDSGEPKTGEKQPTQAEIDAELKKLEDEYDTQAYARARKPLYPPIGDQLDDLYHKGAFSTDMAAKIKKVKDDNPKPK